MAMAKNPPNMSSARTPPENTAPSSAEPESTAYAAYSSAAASAPSATKAYSCPPRSPRAMLITGRAAPAEPSSAMSSIGVSMASHHQQQDHEEQPRPEDEKI